MEFVRTNNALSVYIGSFAWDSTSPNARPVVFHLRLRRRSLQLVSPHRWEKETRSLASAFQSEVGGLPSSEESVFSSTGHAPLGCPGISAEEPVSHQYEAWKLIDSLSVQDILPPRTVQYLSPALRASFQECCTIPLRKIE